MFKKTLNENCEAEIWFVPIPYPKLRSAATKPKPNLIQYTVSRVFMSSQPVFSYLCLSYGFKFGCYYLFSSIYG